MPVVALKYQSGFGNEFATEAIAGGLPQGQNAPQKHSWDSIRSSLAGPPLPRLGMRIDALGLIASSLR